MDTITFGTRAQPMVWYFMCDNNGIYPQTFYLGTNGNASSTGDIKSGYDIRSRPFTGIFYGLLVINESVLHIAATTSPRPRSRAPSSPAARTTALHSRRR